MALGIFGTLSAATVAAVGLSLLAPSAGGAQVLRPDLVVNSLSAPPPAAYPGDGFVVATSSVTNQGGGASVASVTKFYLVSSTDPTKKKNLKGTQAIAALPPGASDGSSVSLSVYSDTDPGTYVMQACADGGKVNTESSESNNCFTTTATIIVRDVPDLVVTLIDNPPASAPQGQTFQAKSTVKNMRTVEAKASTTKYYLVSNADQSRIDLKSDPLTVAVPLLPSLGVFTQTATLTVRAETTPGTYRLQSCADSGKVQPEKDEENNCLTSAGAVLITPQPDLLVKKVTVTGAPLSVDQGGTLAAVEVVVRNDGLANAPASKAKFLLVTSGPTPTQKNLKAPSPTAFDIPAVPMGTKFTLTTPAIVYDDTEPGIYTLQVCVDTKKVVAESSESNNCGTADGTITVTGLPLSPADLAVTTLTEPPATRKPGESFEITADVKNHGTAAPDVDTVTKFYLLNAARTARKNLKGVQPVPSGDLGAGVTVSAPITVEVYSDTVPGIYTLVACADGDEGVHEADEDDNCKESQNKITVKPVPNLAVTAINNVPGTIAPGTTFTPTGAVKNTGAPADATTVKFYLVSTTDETVRTDLKGVQAVHALVAGETFPIGVTLTVRPETLPGLYHVQGCADSEKVVPESEEDDNCFTSGATMEVTALPDLIVNNVKLATSAVTVARGGTVEVTGVVKNQGLADAGASTMKYSLVVTPGAAPVKNLTPTAPVPAVVKGTRQTTVITATVPLSTPLGTYVVQGCVDTAKVVAESSEENNCGTSTATVTVTP